MTTNKPSELIWEKVLELNALAEGRVQPATCYRKTVCMTRFKGQYAALEKALNHPGPLSSK